MNILQKIAFVLIIIGAINWLLIGIFDFNLVSTIFDMITPIVTRIIYAIVGVAGLISISVFFTNHEDNLM